MKFELCDEFFYRVSDEKLNLFAEFNTSKENLLRNNDKIRLYAGEWVKVKVNDYKTHCVKPMETLKQIANKYNVEMDYLKQKNDLKTDRVFIGQILKI